MRRHTTRLRAGLLAFFVGAAVLSLLPTPGQPDVPRAPVCEPAPARPADPPAVIDEDTTKEAGPRVTQQLWVDFPKAGLLHVRAVENYGEPMRVEVLDVEKDALLYSFPAPTEEPPDADAKYGNPFLRFRVLRVEGLPQPLIFVVAVMPGVSGHGFSAMLIGEVGGRLKVLTPETLDTNNQGGIHVGDLGGGRGAGVAVWWPVWDTGCEGHYSAHRFEVSYHPLDSRTKRFRKGKTLRSKRKYGGHGEGALKELGLGFTDLLQDIPDVSEYHWL